MNNKELQGLAKYCYNSLSGYIWVFICRAEQNQGNYVMTVGRMATVSQRYSNNITTQNKEEKS